jgi:hypothetical protein
MKNKKWIIIFLFTLVVIVASFFVSQYVASALENLSGDVTMDQVKSEFSNKSYVLLYIQCFLVLFTSICLPFIWSTDAIQSKINKHNWWKPILVVELTGLLMAYLTTPPDFFSTILVFILWQLPVVINLIALSRIVRKNKPH